MTDELESGCEQAAEALVTMREARQQLQTVRRDRGYGKAGERSTMKAKVWVGKSLPMGLENRDRFV